MPVPHSVVVVAGDTPIRDWTSYSIEASILSPADQFSLTIAPISPGVWDAVAPDTEVKILVDGRVICTGYVDDRSASGGQVTITGRDRAGRMVDESMDLIDFRDATLRQVILRAARPWFSGVTVSNAGNRRAMLGRRASLAKFGSEPASESELEERKGSPRQVDPGQTRWGFMAEFLRETEFLAWSSADGKELVVGRPNYTQDPQFRFTVPGADSDRPVRLAANVVQRTVTDSLAEAYDRVTVVGSDVGSAANRGKSVSFEGTVVDASGFFQRRKQLIMSENAKSPADARRIARNELALRFAGSRTISLTVRGHDQRRTPDSVPALYAPDTVAEYTDEELGEVVERYLITSCTYRSGPRPTPATTAIEMVPVGTTLRLQ